MPKYSNEEQLRKKGENEKETTEKISRRCSNRINARRAINIKKEDKEKRVQRGRERRWWWWERGRGRWREKEGRRRGTGRRGWDEGN